MHPQHHLDNLAEPDQLQLYGIRRINAPRGCWGLPRATTAKSDSAAVGRRGSNTAPSAYDQSDRSRGASTIEVTSQVIPSIRLRSSVGSRREPESCSTMGRCPSCGKESSFRLWSAVRRVYGLEMWPFASAARPL